MSKYALQVVHGKDWGYVIPADTAEEMFNAEVARFKEPGATWDFRTVMRLDDGAEISVSMRRGCDADGPYYWACCAVNYCVQDAHTGNQHVDATGFSWTEGE
ncbi:hypothetical protein ACFP2T_43345 [Plantactinospora solaniradicis]|uniref:Uncharacterized protein n=1 Tax=Plantactinospora solaniradicis TaxID=1723736 RepID=A0ABW1KPT5_9ACTN